MPGNTFGTLFRVTTWGESHGSALGVVIDGCPPRIPLTEKDIQLELDRRKPGQSKVTSLRQEKDLVRILSGVFEGKTLGTPIAMMVENKDQRPNDYSNLKNAYRPGHADLSWELKYGIRDYRGGGRASGRETMARVMAGAVAKKILHQAKKVKIIGHAIQIGPFTSTSFDSSIIEKNSVRCADAQAAQKMEKAILEIQKKKDSLGGIIEIIVQNMPCGLGEPVFDKLHADLGKALLSIGGVKGIEFGDGFAAAISQGSKNNDAFVQSKDVTKITTKTNHAGGLYGGISIGTDLIIRLAVKPTSSIGIEGRHDPCIVPRLIPVAESMVAITLTDHYLRQKTPT